MGADPPADDRLAGRAVELVLEVRHGALRGAGRDRAHAPAARGKQLAHEGEVGAEHVGELGHERAEEGLARLGHHALGDARDEGLLALAVRHVARDQHDAGRAADVQPLARELEGATPPALHDEGHLVVAHASGLANAPHPALALRGVGPEAQLDGRAPDDLGLLVARGLLETRVHEEDPVVGEAHDGHRVRARADGALEELLRLLQPRASGAQRLVHEHGGRDVGQRGSELLLVGRPLAALADRLQAHHALRLALLPDAGVQHRDDVVGAEVVGGVLARARVGGGVGRHDGARPAKRLEVGRVAGGLERLGRAVPPGGQVEEIDRDEPLVVVRQQPDRGAPGVGRARGGLGEGRPRHLPAGRGHAALQQREERGLLRLRAEPGCLAASVHAVVPLNPR